MKAELESQGTISLGWSRSLDYLMLTKPELTFLSVLTALAGYALGAEGTLVGAGMLHTIAGTGLVGGGAGVLNQFIERDYDAQMRRTEHRPIPAGRVSGTDALVFGSALSLLGVADLLLFVNPLTAFLSALTLLTYLLLYTPLKRITPFSTLVGAVPGALPPVMGWTGARNSIEPGAMVLFAILFLWQLPHFHALAWVYRNDYARAGYRLLAVVDPVGTRTSMHVLVAALLLIPVSVLLSATGETGIVYAVGAAATGIAFLVPAARLARDRSSASARSLFVASLLYLPILMLLMLADRLLA